MGKRRRIDAVKTEFAEAAERPLDDVHAYLVYLTGDRGTAEELAAETFARACERWHRFDPRRGAAGALPRDLRGQRGQRSDRRRGGARAWLCQLARSTALDHFRAEERRRRREGRYAV